MGGGVRHTADAEIIVVGCVNDPTETLTGTNIWTLNPPANA